MASNEILNIDKFILFLAIASKHAKKEKVAVSDLNNPCFSKLLDKEDFSELADGDLKSMKRILDKGKDFVIGNLSGQKKLGILLQGFYEGDVVSENDDEITIFDEVLDKQFHAVFSKMGFDSLKKKRAVPDQLEKVLGFDFFNKSELQKKYDELLNKIDSALNV